MHQDFYTELGLESTRTDDYYKTYGRMISLGSAGLSSIVVLELIKLFGLVYGILSLSIVSLTLVAMLNSGFAGARH
jgi:hypothetical protein